MTPLEEFQELIYRHRTKTGLLPSVVMLPWPKIQLLWNQFREGVPFNGRGEIWGVPAEARMPFRVYGVVIRPIE